MERSWGEAEEGGELRKQQPYQCWNGSAVGDIGLLGWDKRSRNSFHPTFMGAGFFSPSLSLHAALGLHIRYAETFPQTSGRA